ncbi:VOC family protein [Actinomadura sp. NPDC048955]|uniref:VOC family protein n=1 Tax=Actinomadura sp. NPDC048955 TaxID=3158228 RepID=UPI0033D7D334
MAYVELNVANDETVVDYFTRRLMFDQVAVAHKRATRSTLLRSNSAQVIVTTPTSGDGPVVDFLARHGDGVADIALHHTDVHALVARAHRSGLKVLAPVRILAPERVITARIAGAGSVTHTLIDSSTHLLRRLPPGFPWQADQLTLPGPATPRAALARPQSIDHLTWYLPADALERATAHYKEAFEMSITTSCITAGAGVAHSNALSSSGLVFVLTAPDARHPDHVGQINEFLTTHNSAGVHHVALRTGDIVTAARLLKHTGATLLHAPIDYYEHIPASVSACRSVRARVPELLALGILVDYDEHGLLYQILGSSPLQRGALHYELIQREGAAGFGRRSARALLQM